MLEGNRRSFLAKSSAAAGGIIGLAGCLGGESDAVQLGAINPLSGSAAAYGELATETQGAWVDRVNGNGGLDVGDSTREVEIVEYDDESSNDQAQSAAQRLADVDNVSMILSAWRSNGTIAINPIINSNQIPTFTNGFTPQVNEEGTYMMRLTVSTVMDAYPALQLISDSDDIDTVGVIAEEGDWGDDTLDLMEWWFETEDNSGSYENLGRFSFDQQDFSSFITSARNTDVDALYIQTWASAMQRFILQQDREGLNDEMPILTGLGGADYNDLGEVGNAVDNFHALGVYTRLSYADNEEIRETISDDALSQFEEYQEMDTPDHPTAYNVYANAQAAQYAIEEAGSTNSSDLREALVDNEFTTILGDATINDRGQPAIPAAYIKFASNGDEAVVDTVEWSGQLPPITNIPPETDL